MGECRSVAPSSDGWPAVCANDWCVKYSERAPTGIKAINAQIAEHQRAISDLVNTPEYREWFTALKTAEEHTA